MQKLKLLNILISKESILLKFGHLIEHYVDQIFMEEMMENVH